MAGMERIKECWHGVEVVLECPWCQGKLPEHSPYEYRQPGQSRHEVYSAICIGCSDLKAGRLVPLPCCEKALANVAVVEQFYEDRLARVIAGELREDG